MSSTLLSAAECTLDEFVAECGQDEADSFSAHEAQCTDGTTRVTIEVYAGQRRHFEDTRTAELCDWLDADSGEFDSLLGWEDED
jgi:hypothetical protein